VTCKLAHLGVVVSFRRHARLALSAVLVLASFGCARALTPIDPGSALATADPAAADPAEAARLIALAETVYAQRPDEKAVVEAERLWLEAAVVDASAAAPIIGAVRAQTWLAEYATERDVRRAKATESAATAQWCRRREVANPHCSYYLALAVGVQVNQNRATTAEGLAVIVRALENAIVSDERLDYAGPHRCSRSLSCGLRVGP